MPAAISHRTALVSLIALVTLVILFKSNSSSAPNLPPRPAFKGTPALPTPTAASSSIANESPIFSSRIVTVADIHGDLPHLMRILRSAKLIDLKNSWIGGEAILVQTGDIVDRGKDTIALYQFFDALRPQAEEVGGSVVSLLGNHEMMNAMGDWRYVTKEDIATFGGERNRRAAMTTGWIGQTWRANYSITARVPLLPTNFTLPDSLKYKFPASETGRTTSQLYLVDPIAPNPSYDAVKDPFVRAGVNFVHGGITPDYLLGLNSETPIAKINEIGSSILYSLIQGAPSPLTLPRNATTIQKEFWSERGPMWSRVYALEEDEEKVCTLAERACKMLGVRHLVMGHTPFFEGIVSRCDGKILLIDTGISRAYGGALSALEISTNLKQRGHPANREWDETEIVTALYLDKAQVLHTYQRTVTLPEE